MSNVYGVAHFAKQNAVPQVEWKNVDIIGQYIDNLNKQKQLEMMDRNYELAKDQAAFAREKFDEDVRQFNTTHNFNVDKDVKDRLWEEFKFNNLSAKDRQDGRNHTLEALMAKYNIINNQEKLQSKILYDVNEVAKNFTGNTQDFHNFALDTLGERYKDDFNELNRIVSEFMKDRKIGSTNGISVQPGQTGQTGQTSSGKGTNSSKWKIQ